MNAQNCVPEKFESNLKISIWRKTMSHFRLPRGGQRSYKTIKLGLGFFVIFIISFKSELNENPKLFYVFSEILIYKFFTRNCSFFPHSNFFENRSSRRDSSPHPGPLGDLRTQSRANSRTTSEPIHFPE